MWKEEKIVQMELCIKQGLAVKRQNTRTILLLLENKMPSHTFHSLKWRDYNTQILQLYFQPNTQHVRRLKFITYTYTHTPFPNTHYIYIHTHIYTQTDTHMCAHTHTHMRTWAHHTRARTRTHTHIHTRTAATLKALFLVVVSLFCFLTSFVLVEWLVSFVAVSAIVAINCILIFQDISIRH